MTEGMLKVSVKNIEYNDEYKSIALNARPSEITVEIPDTTTREKLQVAVFAAIAKQHSVALANGIENADCKIIEGGA